MRNGWPWLRQIVTKDFFFSLFYKRLAVVYSYNGNIFQLELIQTDLRP